MPIFSWIMADKPEGMHSMWGTKMVKKAFQGVRAGHVGTLDPLASGLLPIALGYGSRLIPYIMQEAKTYTFTISWGRNSTTDDSLGVVGPVVGPAPLKEDLCKLVASWKGEFFQKPPQYCARKIQGKRAYTLAQQGEVVELQEKSIYIYDFSVLQTSNRLDLDNTICPYGWSQLTLTCSSGTYVRSFARDLAAHLGTGGHICQLRRTSIGKFSPQVSLQELQEIPPHERRVFLQTFCLPPAVIWGERESVFLSNEEGRKILKGLWVSWPKEPKKPNDLGCFVGEILVAISHWDQGYLKPFRCFPGVLQVS